MRLSFRLLLAGTGLALTAGVAGGAAIAAQGDQVGDSRTMDTPSVDMPSMEMRGPGMSGPGMHKQNGHSGFHQQNRGRFGDRRHGSVTKADAQARARERFARFDANSDGVIDAAEVGALVDARRERRQARRGGRRSSMRWQRKLRRFDADGNGKISRSEFDARLKQRFARLDLTNDGAITDADLPPGLRGRNFLSNDAVLPPRMGRRAGSRGHRGRKLRRFSRLRMANTDNNGTVTSAEFFDTAANRFSRMDKNGDGVIDQADRDARRVEATTYRVARFMHRFGADASGTVTRQQFESKAAERFAKRDVDGDGVLSGAERGKGRHMKRWSKRGHRMGRGMRGGGRHHMGRGFGRGSHGGSRGSGQ